MSAPDPRTVICPVCGATTGYPCTAPTEFSRRAVKWFHAARADRAAGWGE